MVVGLVGAVLTAAYMTRCVYLTFFGEYRGHAPPARVADGDHRSRSIVLAGFSIVAGLANASRVRHREVREVRRADGRVPAGASTPDFDVTLAAVVVLRS